MQLSFCRAREAGSASRHERGHCSEAGPLRSLLAAGDQRQSQRSASGGAQGDQEVGQQEGCCKAKAYSQDSSAEVRHSISFCCLVTQLPVCIVSTIQSALCPTYSLLSLALVCKDMLSSTHNIGTFPNLSYLSYVWIVGDLFLDDVSWVLASACLPACLSVCLACMHEASLHTAAKHELTTISFPSIEVEVSRLRLRLILPAIYVTWALSMALAGSAGMSICRSLIWQKQ